MATVKTASSSRYQEKDVDGFDREADTVGAGIYSGNVKRDENGNVIQGRVINLSSSNSFLNSNNRLLVGIGLKNIIAITKMCLKIVWLEVIIIVMLFLM